MRQCMGDTSTISGTRRVLKKSNSLFLKKKNPTQAWLTHVQGCHPWLGACDAGSERVVGGTGASGCPRV